MVDELDVGGVILTDYADGELRWYFVVRIVLLSGSSLSSESSFDDEVEFRRNSWNLVESRPVTIEAGFLSESAS